MAAAPRSASTTGPVDPSEPPPVLFTVGPPQLVPETVKVTPPLAVDALDVSAGSDALRGVTAPVTIPPGVTVNVPEASTGDATTATEPVAEAVAGVSAALPMVKVKATGVVRETAVGGMSTLVVGVG